MSSPTLMTRLGLRYRFIDGRAPLRINVTDPFAIYDSSIERNARSCIETGRERVSVRGVMLSLSGSFQSGAGRRDDGDRRGDRRRQSTRSDP